MEPNNLIAGVRIHLTQQGLPEEQIRREVFSLNPGDRVFIECGNICPTRPMPGLENAKYSTWYNPNLIYVWLSKNPRVRALWITEHQIADQEFRGGNK